MPELKPEEKVEEAPRVGTSEAKAQSVSLLVYLPFGIEMFTTLWPSSLRRLISRSRSSSMSVPKTIASSSTSSAQRFELIRKSIVAPYFTGDAGGAISTGCGFQKEDVLRPPKIPKLRCAEDSAGARAQCCVAPTAHQVLFPCVVQPLQ